MSRYGKFRSIEELIEDSENYRHTPPGGRSRLRHTMIEQAQRLKDDSAWIEVGNALIRAADVDDLTPQISDHFVRACPDSIFTQLPPDSAACKFRGWREKSLRAHTP